MEYLEAKEILVDIQRLFPNFNKNRDVEVAKTWIRLLQKGDYERTKRKLDEYVTESSYPPNVADILVKEYKPRDDGMAEQIRAAEEKVRQEKADPEKAARREQLLNEMRKKLGEYYDDWTNEFNGYRLLRENVIS